MFIQVIRYQFIGVGFALYDIAWSCILKESDKYMSIHSRSSSTVSKQVQYFVPSHRLPESSCWLRRVCSFSVFYVDGGGRCAFLYLSFCCLKQQFYLAGGDGNLSTWIHWVLLFVRPCMLARWLPILNRIVCYSASCRAKIEKGGQWPTSQIKSFPQQSVSQAFACH